MYNGCSMITIIAWNSFLEKIGITSGVKGWNDEKDGGLKWLNDKQFKKDFVMWLVTITATKFQHHNMRVRWSVVIHCLANSVKLLMWTPLLKRALWAHRCWENMDCFLGVIMAAEKWLSGDITADSSLVAPRIYWILTVGIGDPRWMYFKPRVVFSRLITNNRGLLSDYDKTHCSRDQIMENAILSAWNYHTRFLTGLHSKDLQMAWLFCWFIIVMFFRSC